MQIMTDVLDRPMVTSAVPEASSRGAALLALEAMGALPDLAAAPAPLGEEHRPDASRTRVYRAAMARQQALYQRLFGTGTAT
jgi:gluconokinase